jgi:hypothetical protein
VTIPQFCFRESLDPLPGARVILTNRVGRATGVLNRFGRGTALRVAALPGVAYLQAAVTAPGYDPATFVPPDYPAALRDFLREPCRLANVEPVATFAETGLEAVRYDAADRIVLFVLDHRNQTRPAVTISLPEAGSFRRAESATGHPVRVEPQAGNTLKLTLRLAAADAFVLRR